MGLAAEVEDGSSAPESGRRARARARSSSSMQRSAVLRMGAEGSPKDARMTLERGGQQRSAGAGAGVGAWVATVAGPAAVAVAVAVVAAESSPRFARSGAPVEDARGASRLVPAA